MDDKQYACYGAYKSSARCRRCLYGESCRYYALTERQMECEHASGSVHFDRVENWFPECADDEHIPGQEEEREGMLTMFSALSGFFRYLLDLDDYELGILCEIIAPRSGCRKPLTVPRLARLHGCSRQAMHKKLMKMIGRHPELAGMLQLIMLKVTRGRQLFRRRRAGEAAPCAVMG